MSRLSRRVERLECQQPSSGPSVMDFLGDLLEKTQKVRAWLRERGHSNATSAVEASVKCPVGMEDVWDLMLRADQQRRCTTVEERIVDLCPVQE